MTEPLFDLEGPDDERRLSALLDLHAIPRPDGGKLLALAIAEILGKALSGCAGSFEEFRFGAAGRFKTPAKTLAAFELLGRFVTELEGRPPGDSTTRKTNDLVARIPRGGLTPDARDALSRILEIGGTTDPMSETTGRAAARSAARREAPSPPSVAIVIPTLDSPDLLSGCLASLEAEVAARQDAEVIVVMNAQDEQGPDAATRAAVARFPFARMVPLRENTGFAKACNLGAREADADVVIFLNDDTKVAPGWLRELLAAITEGAAAACSLVLSQDGETVDFAGGGASFEGKGFQDGFGSPDIAGFALAKPILFGNGAGFAIDRTLFLDMGGFDESFFAYYEDVDLGMRLALRGETVTLAPRSRIFHRHNATSKRFPAWQKEFHMERNGLAIVLKTFEAGSLAAILPAALLLFSERVLAHRAIDRALRVAALAEVLDRLPDIAKSRCDSQAARSVSDRELFPKMGHFHDRPPVPDAASYRLRHETISLAMGVSRLSRRRRSITIFTHEDLTDRLAGPGIRVVELGRTLAAAGHDVTVATPDARIEVPGVSVVEYDRFEERSLKPILRDADVVVAQGHLLDRYGSIAKAARFLVCDLYCPFPLENLEYYRGGPPPEATLGSQEGDLEALTAKLVAGDYFLAATEKQRDLWMGALLACGRVNSLNYSRDPLLHDLLGVVPFGLPREPPQGPLALKGIYPGIRPNDKVLLWGGSLLDWQDPLTVIRAVARLREKRDDVKLFFMGVNHPTPGVKEMAMVERARNLARELGLHGSHVFFNDWVPYKDRAGYLLDADIGVLAHRLHLETRYSFRTRLLDCLWAGLPMLQTRGDAIAELVAQEGLGLTVPPGDEAAFAEAVERLLEDAALRREIRSALRRVAPRYRWERVAEPLLCRLEDDRRAADHLYARQRGWRRLLRKLRLGRLLHLARKQLPPSARRGIKRLLGWR